MKWTSAQAVELGDNDRAFRFPSSLKRRSQVRSAVERVRALPRLDFRVGPDHFEALSLSEGEDRLPLSLQAKPRPPLPLGRYPVICDRTESIAGRNRQRTA
jgi:hypothetical protein